jgi:uncharacterized protein (DUF2235 family)
MGRNLVICFDGTGPRSRAKGDSNVIKVFSMLDLFDPTTQIAYYDPGAGTFASSASWGPLARWLSRLGGLAFGNGLRQNLGEAYSWLMQEWSPGDRIFVFGFSRDSCTEGSLLQRTRPNEVCLVLCQRGEQFRFRVVFAHRFTSPRGSIA